jgi:hypothetical protein
MRILKPAWAHETVDHLQAPGRPGREAASGTLRGLGAGESQAPEETSSAVEQRWVALVKQGLFDLDGVPVLLRGNEEEAGNARRDEVESYVVTRVESGATLRALLAGGDYPADDVLRAMARLAHRELLRLS